MESVSDAEGFRWRRAGDIDLRQRRGVTSGPKQPLVQRKLVVARSFSLGPKDGTNGELA
jgi:hypothetical protein